MRFKLLLFAVAWIVAMALIVNDSPSRMLETFQQASAALVCYWSDPGPPLAVPMPPDPQSIGVKGAPPNAPVDFKTAAQRETQIPEYLKSATTRPLRDVEITPSPTPSPSSISPNAVLPSPFEEPSIPPTPVPTLGVLAVAPEVSATPRTLLIGTIAPILMTSGTTEPATFKSSSA